MRCCGERVSTFWDLDYCRSGNANGNRQLILSNDLWHSCDEVAAAVSSLISPTV